MPQHFSPQVMAQLARRQLGQRRRGTGLSRRPQAQGFPIRSFARGGSFRPRRPVVRRRF